MKELELLFKQIQKVDIVVISEENRKKLRTYIDNADQKIDNDKIDDILEELDRAMVYELMDNDEEPTNRWYEMQKVFDLICVENKE